MKKNALAIIITTVILSALCACGAKRQIEITPTVPAETVTATTDTQNAILPPAEIAPETASSGEPASTSSAAELVTGLQTPSTKKNAESPAAAGGLSRVSYGANTGTAQTLTGFAPLPKASFDLSAMRTGLSTATVDHSFGVAQDGKPHSISVEAQKAFDENGLDAVVYDNRTEEQVLYLTFDCGYDNGQTEKILDTLREKNVPAAFFCTLPEMQSVPELTARMIKEGHIVGNHSVNHPDFTSISHERMLEEVKGADDWLRENCGYSAGFFRFPMGKYSMDAVAALNAMGYRCVFWSLAYYDWDLQKQPGADAAFDTVIARLHPGAVILLHSVSPSNAEALPRIIDTARAMGYEFKALNQQP